MQNIFLFIISAFLFLSCISISSVIERKNADNYYYAENGIIKDAIVLKTKENKYYFYKENREIAIWIFYENGEIIKKGEIITGTVIQFYDTGRIMSKFNFKNNKRESEYFVYYETGEIQEQGNYENDILNGFYKIYDKKGNIIERGYYNKGKKEILFKRN